MWYQHGTRNELLGFVEPMPCNVVRAKSERDDAMPNARDELVFLWKDDPSISCELPNVIVVANGRLQEFFAWTSTYLKACQPLSAVCRTVTPQEATAFSQSSPSSFSFSLQSVALGLIIAETATYADTVDISRLPRVGFAGTLSFVLSRALSLPDSAVPLEELGHRWKLTRELTKQREVLLDFGDVLDVWSIALATVLDQRKAMFSNMVTPTAQSRDIVAACEQIRSEGALSPNTWDKLTRGLIDKGFDPDELSGPREDRVAHVEAILGNISRKRQKRNVLQGFVCGYIASRIAPGSIEHISLLKPFLAEIPSLLLWYALCASLDPRCTIQNFGNGLGRRIIADITRCNGFFDRPTCDIAFAELETAWRGDNAKILGDASGIAVEISPCLDAMVGRQKDATSAGLGWSLHENQRQLFSQNIREHELQEIISELSARLGSIDILRRRLEQFVSEPPKDKKRKWR